MRGLTTAAAIWSVAAVGVIAGAARFVLATLLAALFLLVLEMPSVPLPKRLDPVRWAHRFTNDNPPSDGDREAG